MFDWCRDGWLVAAVKVGGGMSVAGEIDVGTSFESSLTDMSAQVSSATNTRMVYLMQYRQSTCSPFGAVAKQIECKRRKV